jgi:hypothetical protein
VLVHDVHIRVLSTSGRLLRDLTLDPTRDHQPQAERERCRGKPTDSDELSLVSEGRLGRYAQLRLGDVGGVTALLTAERP